MSLYPKMEVLSEKLPPVEALDGDELVFVLDDPSGSPTPKVATTQQIADLGGGGGAFPRLRFSCRCAYSEEGLESFAYAWRPGSTVSGDISVARITNSFYQLTFEQTLSPFLSDFAAGTGKIVIDSFNGGVAFVTITLTVDNLYLLNVYFSGEFDATVEFDYWGS